MTVLSKIKSFLYKLCPRISWFPRALCLLVVKGYEQQKQRQKSSQKAPLQSEGPPPIRRPTCNNISTAPGMADTREKPTSTGNRRRKGGQGTHVGHSSPSPGSRRTAAERTRRSYQRCLAALSYWA